MRTWTSGSCTSGTRRFLGAGSRSALILLAAAAALVPNLPFERDLEHDAGVYVYIAQRMFEGGLPYRDVWDHKPPGIHLLTAAGLALGGGTTLGVWALELVALAFAGYMSFGALARAFGRGAALLGSVVWIVGSSLLYLAIGSFTIYAEFFALPLQFGALRLLVADDGRSRARVALLGLSGGAVVLLKPSLVGLWLAIAVVIALEHHSENGALKLARRLALLAGTAALPIVAVLVPLAALGVLPDLWDQAIRYNTVYVRPALEDSFGALGEALWLLTPSGLWVAGLVGWLFGVGALWRGRLARAPRTLVLVAVLDLPLEVVLGMLPGRRLHHYFLALVPPTAVLTAQLAERLAALAAPRLRGSFVHAGAGAAMVALPLLLLAWLTLSPTDGKMAEAAAYIAHNTGPAERVLVWGSRAGVLVEAGRLSSTRFVYQLPLYTVGYSTPAMVEAFRAELEARRPAVIVDASSVTSAVPPLDRAAARGHVSSEPRRYAALPEIDAVIAFVEREYELVGTLPRSGWRVFAPRR